MSVLPSSSSVDFTLHDARDHKHHASHVTGDARMPLDAISPASSFPLSLLSAFTALLDQRALPAGAIVMFAGKNVPQGWHECDGSNGTPDLRYLFVRGAALADVGAGSGVLSTTLTSSHIPSHTHAATLGDASEHTHTSNTNTSPSHTTYFSGAAPSHNHLMELGGAHSHYLPSYHGNMTSPDMWTFAPGGHGAPYLPNPNRWTSVVGDHTHTVGGGGSHTHTITPSHGHTVDSKSHSHSISTTAESATAVVTTPRFVGIKFIMKAA